MLGTGAYLLNPATVTCVCEDYSGVGYQGRSIDLFELGLEGLNLLKNGSWALNMITTWGLILGESY